MELNNEMARGDGANMYYRHAVHIRTRLLPHSGALLKSRGFHMRYLAALLELLNGVGFSEIS